MFINLIMIQSYFVQNSFTQFVFVMSGMTMEKATIITALSVSPENPD